MVSSCPLAPVAVLQVCPPSLEVSSAAVVPATKSFGERPAIATKRRVPECSVPTWRQVVPSFVDR